MGISRNKKNRRRPKYGWGNRMALIGITAVILSLAVVEKVAKEKLGLVKKDEILFKPEESE